jgi:hypothetical protein
MEGINVPAFTAWVERLESGQDEQGGGFLNDMYGRMCCLGVACEMFTDDLGLVVTQGDASFWYNGSNMYMPVEVADHLGIPESHRENSSLGVDIKLSKGDLISELNDSGDYDFPDIAAILREEFLECG